MPGSWWSRRPPSPSGRTLCSARWRHCVVGQRAERRQRGAEIVFGLGEIGEARRRGIEVDAEAAQGRAGDVGADVVDHQPADRGAGLGRQHHADQAAQRVADPVDLLDVEPGQERIHVGAVLQQRVARRLGQPTALAAPDQIGADHAPALAGEGPRQDVEVAPLSGQAVHADQRALGVPRAPFPIGQAMEAAQGQAEIARQSRRHPAVGPSRAASSAAVSKTCGAISRRCSASPSLRRMKALVV